MTNDRIVSSGHQEDAGRPLSHKVLVVGSGLICDILTSELLALGYGVIRTSPDDELTNRNGPLAGMDHLIHEAPTPAKEQANNKKLEILPPAQIMDFHGAPGCFRVHLKVDDDRGLEKPVGAVVLATAPELEAPLGAWGLEKSNKVCSLSELESTLESELADLLRSEREPFTAVFLCGFTHRSYPFSQKRALDAAVSMASKGKTRVLFILEDLKVADYGLEQLTLKAREAGVLFVKMTGTRPHIQREGERLAVYYDDESLGEQVKVHPDLLVLEEAYRAPKETAILAERLGIGLDHRGFFQTDNIYNQPTYTNRTGVWVVGSAKGPVSLQAGADEAKAVVLEIHQFFRDADQVASEAHVLFDRGKCGKCLTCYRLCPHRAISCFEASPVFYDLACKACGICSAACPMDAIQIPHFSDREILSQIEHVRPDGSCEKKEGIARIVAFCCENSAFEAARLAALRRLPLPEGLELVKLPCAGRIDLGSLLKAFDFGADGVMVLGCHDESCKSVKGNTIAQQRVEIIRRTLGDIGLEKDHVFFGTLAPGMSSEFVNMTKQFLSFFKK